MIINESPPLALPSTVSSSELPDGVPESADDAAQHPLLAIRKRMMEGSHKHSNNVGSPNKRRHCPTPVPEHQQQRQQQHQDSPAVSLMCHSKHVDGGGHGDSPKTPNPTHFMSSRKGSSSRLPTPRTPGRNHDELAQDTNWTRKPPTFFRLPRRRLSGMNLAGIIEVVAEKDLLRMDLEEGKVTGVDDVSLKGMRMQPRFDSKELAEIFALSSRDRSHPAGAGTGIPPLPAPPIYQEELKQPGADQDDEHNAKIGSQQQKQETQQGTGTSITPPPAPPLYQEEMRKRAEVEKEDEQNVKTGAQQQEEQQAVDATGDEGTSSLPTSKLAAMNLGTARQEGKLSEAAPRVVREQRPNRPGRRLSAPSA